jgi:hypothetical protein
MSPDEEWLLKAVEEVLDTHLLQQWLPGYEPDLSKKSKSEQRHNSGANKKRARQKAFGEVRSKAKKTNQRNRR